MERLQSLIVALRTLRSELNIPPDKPAPALIRTENDAVVSSVRRFETIFGTLARVSELDIGPEVARPAQAPRKVLEFAEVFLPLDGVIDIAAERVRLVQERTQVEADLKQALGKLENEEFLKKAPPAIVDKEKQKLEEFQQKLERLEQNLDLLGVKI